MYTIASEIPSVLFPTIFFSKRVTSLNLIGYILVIASSDKKSLSSIATNDRYLGDKL
jgi:hypothetical protein